MPKRTNKQMLNGIERQLRQLNTKIGNQYSELDQRLTSLENYNRVISPLLTHLLTDPSLNPHNPANIYVSGGLATAQPSTPATQSAAPTISLTQEQRNLQEVDRVLQEYVGELQKRRDEDLAAFDREKQDVLKMYTDDPNWKLWTENFYTKKREERRQEYGMWIKGVENFVDGFLKIN